jgi:cell division protein FtsW
MKTNHTDALLVGVVLLLTGLGLYTVYTASGFNDAVKGGMSVATAGKQAVAAIIGLLLLAFFRSRSYRRIRTWRVRLWGFPVPTTYLVWVLSLVAMGLVWVPGLGHKANGAARWVNLGPANLQPSEFLKLTTLLALAQFLHEFREKVNDRRVLGLLVAGAGIISLLLYLQNDLGSLIITLGIGFVMLWVAGLRYQYVGGLAGLGAGLVALMVVLEPFRVQRVMSFLDPFEDCRGAGYQVCQSLIAFHNGGLTGQGAGQGFSKLAFLPEAHNDFIAAVFGEEFGLLGMLTLFGLYGLFLWRGFDIARKARDMHGLLLASTITLLIVGQAVLNFAVALGSLPNKGLVLPFMSYGGSAMMVNLAAVGVLLAIHADVPREAPATVNQSAEANLAPRASTGA